MTIGRARSCSTARRSTPALAHSFSPTSVLDVSDAYSYDQNPEAILNGAPVNTDQTLQSNEFDARYTFAPTEKLGLVLKARSVYYDYISQVLGDELNRFENLYGVEFDYSLLPDLKAAGEYRHQDVDYSTDPSDNNKHSDFLMAGFDYNVGPKLTASMRLGVEYRHRDGLSDETSPYAEFSTKYDYAKGSFVSAGYSYSLEETSNPILFSDEKTNRIFVNIQHALSALVVASASVDYEPSTLVGRPGQPDISEDTTHAGAALTYLPTQELDGHGFLRLRLRRLRDLVPGAQPHPPRRQRDCRVLRPSGLDSGRRGRHSH